MESHKQITAAITASVIVVNTNSIYRAYTAAQCTSEILQENHQRFEVHCSDPAVEQSFEPLYVCLSGVLVRCADVTIQCVSNLTPESIDCTPSRQSVVLVE